MVELSINATSEMDLNNCFVAVRIGEVQKMARLPALKTMSFPGAGERQYGKVEVYRRIGSCAVDLDPAKADDRHVHVSCGKAGELRLTIGVQGSNAEEPAPAKGEASARSRAAREYLRRHSIEMQLSEAMQALLKAKPDDPIRFIVDKLLGSQGVGLPQLAISRSSKSLEGAHRRPSEMLAKRETLKEQASLVKIDGLGLLSSPRATSFALMPSVGTWMSVRPMAAPTAEVATGAASAAREVPARFAVAPSVGTWLASASTAPRFTLTASVGTWLTPLPPALKTSRGAASASALFEQSPVVALKPSVGTWLAALPSVLVAASPSAKQPVEVPESLLAPAPVAKSWSLQPSVGTWLLPTAPLVALTSLRQPSRKEHRHEPDPMAPQRRSFVVSSAVFGGGLKLPAQPRLLFI
mmetsp:Transcript_75930/g.220480  ORF Transcript_75930/g.220480 Transcript_75930/m.220480 type:complete len:411 (-) Transcript_75930:69-1301(-)